MLIVIYNISILRGTFNIDNVAYYIYARFLAYLYDVQNISYRKSPPYHVAITLLQWLYAN